MNEIIEIREEGNPGTQELFIRSRTEEARITRWRKFNQITFSITKFGNKRVTYLSFDAKGEIFDKLKKFLNRKVKD